MLGMGCVILLWHSLDLSYNYLRLSPRYVCFVFEFIDGVVDSSSPVTSLPYVCDDVTVLHSFKLKILQAENGNSRRVAIDVLPGVSCLNKVAVSHKFCIPTIFLKIFSYFRREIIYLKNSSPIVSVLRDNGHILSLAMDPLCILCKIYLEIIYVLHLLFFAHLSSMSNYFISNDENRNLGK